MAAEDESLVLELSRDEAIVLFEFIARFSDDETLEIVDQAEERVLWNLCCYLEKHLREPFSPDYARIIEAARARLRDRVDGRD